MGMILGRIAFDGRPVDEQMFRRAFDGLRPGRCLRSDILVEGAAALGHHDTGLAGSAAQPLHDGPLTLVADARLYDRDDLAAALGLSAQDHSDAALILRAYRRWGADCLAHMNGDFGFAIHDRDKGEVFLARDHIGARPLYWARRGAEVLFATLLHGLTGFDDLQWPLSETRIARYLHDPDEFSAKSFIDGVTVVAPGHWVRLSPTGTTCHRWWDPAALPEERQGITLNAAQEELRHLTERAVRARLPANAPVGAHFSGGIDSTLITIMAARMLQASDTNLTAAYAWCPPVSETYPDMGPHDERHVISAQCDALGISQRYGAASGDTFDALVAQPMELQGTADLMDELPTIAQARDDGLGVMLSGWGGDEVFSSHGHGHLSWMLGKGRIGPVLRVARRQGGLRRPHRMAAFLWRAAIVPTMPDRLYQQFSPFLNLYDAGAFPSPEMKRIFRGMEHAPAVRLLADADAYSHALLLNGHIGERMATWAAWSAPAGFEYRYPLTDRKLLEFMLGLPRDIRLGDGTGRFLARRAFADMLPKGVKKYDLVNEKRRFDNRQAWKRRLGMEIEQGRLDQPCPWLDMASLVATIQQDPPADKTLAIKEFARIFIAMRIYEMHARQRV